MLDLGELFVFPGGGLNFTPAFREGFCIQYFMNL